MVWTFQLSIPEATECAHLAAAHGKCSALQAILKTGEDVKREDQRGWTVLHHAAYHGRLGIVQVLSKKIIQKLMYAGNVYTCMGT